MYNTLNNVEASLAGIVGAISFALDLTEGQPAGHALRCTWIGMHIGRELGLDDTTLNDLYYAVILKDAGCSSNAARLWELYGADDRLVKHDIKMVNTQNFAQLASFVFKNAGREDAKHKLSRILHLGVGGSELVTELVQTRCQRGASIARQLGFGDAVAQGIYSLDEHWNGKGHPEGRKGDATPLFSRIALLAQVMDVFYQTGSRHHALTEIRQRSGSWFDPDLVKIALRLGQETELWEGLRSQELETRVSELEPVGFRVQVDEQRLDHIAEVFATIVDIKSPYTHDHSRRVCQYADGIAEELGVAADDRKWIRRGALLHDVGKLGVSNHILDKPGKLDATEWAAVQAHAKLTGEVLQRIAHFGELAPIAAAHHERLDGKGYPLGLVAEQICLSTRIITVADIFDAITATRPYRDAIPVPQTLAIMDKEVGTAIDADCLEALRKHLPAWGMSEG